MMSLSKRGFYKPWSMQCWIPRAPHQPQPYTITHVICYERSGQISRTNQSIELSMSIQVKLYTTMLNDCCLLIILNSSSGNGTDCIRGNQ